jgi:transcriptional regulator with XRE-family HTH domain
MTNATLILENIRILREIKGYTQEYMGIKLGMTQEGYGKIEGGKSKLSMDLLIKISDVLEVEVIDLMQAGQNHYYHMHNNQVANATQIVENLHTDNKEMTDKLIKRLEDEIAFLRRQIDKQKSL